MPEIKHVFNQGKMNKDLDERLVENGQYRHAMNIQVSTSEGSDVGAVQNILGNTSVFLNNQLAPGSKCIGAVADEKENCFYWFVYHPTKSLILKYSIADGVKFVFVDTLNVLEFSGKLITGINVLDNFLFWTSNLNEPKKIDVKLCEQGTNQGGFYHTKLVIPDRGININYALDFLKEHITVIKPSPKSKLLVEPKYDTEVSAKATFEFDDGSGLMVSGQEGVISFSNFVPNSSSFEIGDNVRMLDENSTESLTTTDQIRIKIVEQDQATNTYTFKILSISSTTPTTLITYNCVKESSELIFPRKFIRFGYRYKYNSGEYSTISSFTEPIFKPGSFEYNPKKAYNTAMENNLVSLKLRNFISNHTPLDVVQVDILYTESDSPIIYIVDKIKYTDLPSVHIGELASDREYLNNWGANLYEITADLIYAAIPENQLLRSYDNVPKKALAQEITGNRIVYGNYEQNYDIDNKPIIRGDYVSRYTDNKHFNISYVGNSTSIPNVSETTIVLGEGQQSLKSMRDYQIGISYIDDYGRQSPVFTSNESQFKIPKKHGAYKTKIQGKVLTDPPVWASAFKVYVKETSTEYYNVAMSRVYTASDGDLWLAFPSSERNKIDEETFLILKKATDSNSLVKEEAKYKVLSIENEAPDYIKTEITPLTDLEAGTGSSTNHAESLFGSNPPAVDSRSFDIDKQIYLNGNSSPLHEIKEDIYLAFKHVGSENGDGDINDYTSRYRVKSVNDNMPSTTTGQYNITLEKLFTTADANLIYPDYPETIETSGSSTFVNETKTQSGLKLVLYTGKVVNKPEFKGVFFVKINADDVAQKNIVPKSSGITNYEITNVAHAHYFSDTAAPGIVTGTTESSNTGSTTPGRTNSKDEWKQLLDFGGTSNSLLPNSTGDIIGGFFIDKACYVGVHPAGSADNDDTNNPNHVRFTRNIDSTSNSEVEFGKGIYQENGDWYMELSYSKIGVKATNDKPGINGQGDLMFRHMNRPEIWQPNNNSDALLDYKKNYGGKDDELKEIINKITANSKFKIKDNDTKDQVFTIKSVELEKRYNYLNYEDLANAYGNFLVNGNTTLSYDTNLKEVFKSFCAAHNRRITYKINLGNEQDIEAVKVNGNLLLDSNNIGTSSAVAIQFIEEKTSDNTDIIVSNNPAIFETEPKKTADLDIYYEASEALPLYINQSNNEIFAPKGSVVTCPARPNTITNNITFVRSWANNIVYLSAPLDLVAYQPPGKPAVRLIFTRQDGSYNTAYVNVTATNNSSLPANAYIVQTNVAKNPFALSWFNCFSFNNGVESNRIRDDFNTVTISKGVKASSVLEEPYKNERRKNGLIYSGIYNSDSGVNNLNQFIQAEKITKDLNPSYGSIQKLFSRNTDLITFCEDRVVRVAANKDAVFNADGNPQLIASDRVLGQTMPFAGDYGISTNPESFAKDNYRAYFTDKQRGAVLRLSMDGLTPISEYGMSDYFKDALSTSNITTILGSFDDRKNEYNLTIPSIGSTVSFKESVNGWSSFKSFIPEQAVSVGNSYYTFKSALPYKHHVEVDQAGNTVDRNTFYGTYTPSIVSVLLNDAPDVIKSYKTLGYEGSQSNINLETTRLDSGYYNLENKDGWSSTLIQTDKQKGSVSEFIEKEGKWFNHIKGDNDEIKTDEFSFQGIGRPTTVDFDPSLFVVVNGCTDPNADNYDPTATVDNGSCTYTPIQPTQLTGGCMDDTSSNYDSTADYDDGSCLLSPAPVLGCTDTNAINYNPFATVNDGSCILPLLGCTDRNATNFDPDANVDDGSCVYNFTGVGGSGPTNGGGGGGGGSQLIYGCTNPSADNYNPLATNDDGSCVYTGYSLTVEDLNDDD